MKNGSLHRNRLALLALAGLLAGSVVSAHSPVVDADLSDWCLGAFSNTFQAGGRVENSAANLTCGRCSSAVLACVVSSDCPAAESCIDPDSRNETVWWDDRTDAAVNDLATVAVTQDDTNLYFAMQFWVSPDPVSLPFVEIAIDFGPGGIPTWHDPQGDLTNPGHCSVDVDRACTSDADCHFCTESTEPSPSTRPVTCGSGCNPDLPQDVCDTSQVCVDLGSLGPLPFVGVNSAPPGAPDYLLVFDSGRFLVLAPDSIQLMKDVGGTWTPIAAFHPVLSPGIPGNIEAPTAAVEFAVPWGAFGCTGCPGACSCPDFGPGQVFRFDTMLARALFTLDYTPDGAIEDAQSEAVAGTTTHTTNSCAGFGTVTTDCEIADGSQDAFVPVTGPPVPGGRIDGLLMERGVTPSVTLSWNPSCSVADVDYEIYEGDLRSFYDHDQVFELCTTGGATTVSFEPGPDSHYYLVVPTDGSTEGSYGVDGEGFERPAGTLACKTQLLGQCPDPAGP